MAELLTAHGAGDGGAPASSAILQKGGYTPRRNDEDKQDAFSILFVNRADSVSTSDVRAGSLQGAIESAKA